MAAPLGQGSYSGNPDASTLDQVRFLIQDTRDPFLLSDAELNYCISRYTNALIAAASACDVLAARFTNDVDKRIGNLSVSGGQRAEAWRKRGNELRAQAAREGIYEVFAGGVYEADSLAQDSDSTVIQPHTRVGQDDHPEIGQLDFARRWWPS